MSLVKDVRAEMIAALKAGDKEAKQVYSNIVDALTKEAKSLLVDGLTAEQEVTVINRMVKQLDDSIEKCPASRPEALEKLKFEKSIVEKYMPKQMSEEEIEAAIAEVLTEIGVENPTTRDKGKIMKVLMPKVKGKADGKLVNVLLAKRMH